MRTLISSLVLALSIAVPAQADFDFLGYGMHLELSPLLGPADIATTNPNHDKPYLNDRLLLLRQADPIGLVVDAQFFGLSGAIYGVSCATEGTPCPKAEQAYNGGGYHRLFSLDAALTLDYDNVHPGLGLSFDFFSATNAAGVQENIYAVGGDVIGALSMLGPIYLQAGLGVQPAFSTANNALVGIKTGGEVTAVIAIPWVALYGTAGYQALIPTDPGFDLSHGPYVQVGLMISVGTIFDVMGLGWRAAAGVGEGIGGVIGGGDKKKK